MSELFEKSLRTLELPRVLQLLSGAAVSAEAKERALRVSPETEAEEVLRLLDQTDAARQMIGQRGAPSFSGVTPVGEALDRGEDPMELLPRLADREYVLCREVGCGVVPIHLAERRWREEVGRLCCRLAREAAGVVRLWCGIPVWLKGGEGGCHTWS